MQTSEIRNFRRIQRRFERINNARLKSCRAAVTLAQCLVLLEIDENTRMTMGQLASSLRLDNSTLSRTIDGLVETGHVERLDDKSDRRVVWIRLTEEGNAVCRSIHDENDEYARRVFDRIPASRRKAVLRSFEILVQAFLDCEAESMLGNLCGSTASDGKEVRS